MRDESLDRALGFRRLVGDTADGVGASGLGDLPTLWSGLRGTKNALWTENEPGLRFYTTKRVVIAESSRAGHDTMIHFALPRSHEAQPGPAAENVLGRRERRPAWTARWWISSATRRARGRRSTRRWLNKRRGWNAYFPMPFRKSARVELVYDGPLPPGGKLWQAMPCYSYVTYRTRTRYPTRRAISMPRGGREWCCWASEEYVALEAKGKGKFVGWNVTVRRPGHDDYPVDENEKFFVDGEQEPSVEFQGIEDSFGFSWGFPETQSPFPLTGYYPFFKGACGYRFFSQDAIPFEKSLRVTIGFGKHEQPWYFPRVQQTRDPRAVLQHRVLVPDRAARGLAAAAPGRRAARRRRKTAAGRARSNALSRAK